MNKVICDICGTSYPDTADRCPICGYAKDLNGDNILGLTQQVENTEVVTEEEAEIKAAVPVDVESRNQSRDDDDYDDDFEDDEDDDDDEYDEDDDDEDDEPRSNTFLIVILVILIVALLAVTGFIYMKYFKPNTDKPVETTVATVETTLPAESTELTIPCTGLTMTSEGNVILEKEGHSWLINVAPQPADTTDKILYSSSDESVVTVNETGTLTAVGQGEAVITITCGDQMLTCNVTCFFIEETTAPTGTTAPAEFEGENETTAPVEETTAPAEETTAPADETTAPTEPAETEAATEPAETTEPKDDKTDGEITLTLKRTDLSFGMLGAVYTLEIEEDIDPKDVKWTSANGNIVIVHNGVLRTTGKGVTKIYAEYKGVKAECVIRVSY